MSHVRCLYSLCIRGFPQTLNIMFDVEGAPERWIVVSDKGVYIEIP